MIMGWGGMASICRRGGPLCIHLKIKTTEETSRKVAGIVKEYLNAWFGAEGLVFDPIVVIPRFTFDEDEEYLEIYVVYDGDGDRLDAGYTVTLPRLIRDRITDEEASGPLCHFLCGKIRVGWVEL